IGIDKRLTDQQIATVIDQGKGRMPSFSGLHAAQLTSLLDYLKVGDVSTNTNDRSGKKELASGTSPAPVDSAQSNNSADAYRFTGYRKFLDPDGYPAIAPPWGTLSAIDLNTGKYLWKIPLGEYPALAAQGMKETGSENYGGPIVTAGGLVFIGATVYDRMFRAFDSRTGQLLWETKLPFAGVATPSTYSIDGKQYVVIAASGGRDPQSPTGGTYIAFALP
ncbi:MAG: PQQ-binding-like beta-propeller repeat protein, partial [Silvibacterium sp.]